MPELKPVELQDRDLVSSYLRRYPPEISEHTFTNLHVWRQSHPVSLLEHGGSLLLVAEGADGVVLLGPPVGPLPVRDAVEVLHRAAGGRPVLALERLPESVAGHLDGHFVVEEDRANFDYVYRQRDLAELAGRDLHAKRNLVQRCLSANTCAYERITPALLGEVADMHRRWCEERDCDCDRDLGLCAEYQAIQELLIHYEWLGVIGGTVRVNGAIQAFAIGEPLNDHTAVVHFEKAMSSVQGLYQVINQWFCRDELAAFEYVNREQDLGIPGIRKAKKSYHPHHMVKKYVVRVSGAPPRGSARGSRPLL